MKILGVNGIWNQSVGDLSFTDQLLADLRLLGHHQTYDVSYPRLRAVQAYFSSELESRAIRVLHAHEPGDAVVAHSAGCLLTIIAMHLGARFSSVFLFAAAAEQKAEIPESGADVIYNIHSKDDPVLWLGCLLPFHPFGGLGKWGYRGSNPKVINVPAPGNDHNSYVKHAEKREKWVRFIDGHLLAAKAAA